jgi:CheY-like chemotaxis protein
MPCRDGFEVLHAVRCDAALAGLPVLMFSADPAAEESALRLGAQGFILKGSLDWARLSEAIKKHAGNLVHQPAPL